MVSCTINPPTPPCLWQAPAGTHNIYKNAKSTTHRGSPWKLAHALSRELDQSTAVPHDPHAYATSDLQRRNNDYNRARNISRI